MKKKILIVTSEFPPQPGGIGTHALELAMQWNKEGFNVSVVTDQRSESGVIEQNFDDSLPFKVYRITRQRLRILMYLRRIWYTWKQLAHADVVLASGKFSLWNVSLCNFFFRKKSLAVVHGTEVNFSPYFLRKSIALSLRQFTYIVAVSHYTKGLLPNVKNKVVVIPNGIILSDWEQPIVSKRISLLGSPSILTVGRISERKGQALVVSHLPVLLEHFPELHYHCVGIAKNSEALVETARHLEVERHLTLHGAVSHQQLRTLLSKANVFVMLSTESSDGDVEGFGISLLEANALGIPTVGSINCGIEDAIDDKISGILINPYDADEFVKAIATILKDYDRFSEGAKRWAKSHDWQKIIKQYNALIK